MARPPKGHAGFFPQSLRYPDRGVKRGAAEKQPITLEEETLSSLAPAQPRYFSHFTILGAACSNKPH